MEVQLLLKQLICVIELKLNYVACVIIYASLLTTLYVIYNI